MHCVENISLANTWAHHCHHFLRQTLLLKSLMDNPQKVVQSLPVLILPLNHDRLRRTQHNLEYVSVLQLLVEGAEVDLLYQKLDGKSDDYVKFESDQWARRLQEIADIVIKQDEDIVANYADQVKKDVASIVQDNHDKEQLELLDALESAISKKYYWR